MFIWRQARASGSLPMQDHSIQGSLELLSPVAFAHWFPLEDAAWRPGGWSKFPSLYRMDVVPRSARQKGFIKIYQGRNAPAGRL